MDRKEIVNALAAHLRVTPRYLGAPSFAYEIQTENEKYTIDKNSIITDSTGKEITLEKIMNPGQTVLTSINSLELSLPMDGHTGTTLQNLVNMISSKQHLLKMAFEMDELFMDENFATELGQEQITTVEDIKTAIKTIGEDKCKGLILDFNEEIITFKLTSDVITQEKITAFTTLASFINKNAINQKRVSYKLAQVDNPKYALRTWLTRLGMNGGEYKAIRKVLLEGLEGNGAFRKVPKEGEEK